MALSEAQLIMHVSERKFAPGHALIAYATLRELEEQGFLKEHLPLDKVETCHLTFCQSITVCYAP